MAATHLLIHYVLYCASHARHIYHLCCGASPPLPPTTTPIGRSPLQAVSVSRCSKFFGFQHVACVPPSVWLCGAAPTEGPCLYFTFSVTRSLLHCSAGLRVGRTPKLFVHCTQKCLKLVLCVPNLSHDFRRQSNARCILVITFKPSGSVEINFQLKLLFDTTSL